MRIIIVGLYTERYPRKNCQLGIYHTNLIVCDKPSLFKVKKVTKDFWIRLNRVKIRKYGNHLVHQIYEFDFPLLIIDL